LIFVGVIVRFNIKRRYIERQSAAASEHALADVYETVEKSSPVPSVACVLSRTNQAASDSQNVIAIPAWLPSFPWAGKEVCISIDDDVNVVVQSGSDNESRLKGRRYRALKVPRVVTRSGKHRNVYSPKRYFKLEPSLEQALKVICVKYPAEVLSYLLCPGLNSFEFEPIFQVRIGGSPAWVQVPEFTYCSICRKRMKFVLQVPGTMVGPSKFHEAVVFMFGCVTHPDQYDTVIQFS
jgi:hypothetical protein